MMVPYLSMYYRKEAIKVNKLPTMVPNLSMYYQEEKKLPNMMFSYLSMHCKVTKTQKNTTHKRAKRSALYHYD